MKGGHLAQSGSGELRGKRRENLAEALSQVLRFAGVELGRRKCPPRCLMRRGWSPRTADAGRAQIVEGERNARCVGYFAKSARQYLRPLFTRYGAEV